MHFQGTPFPSVSWNMFPVGFPKILRLLAITCRASISMSLLALKFLLLQYDISVEENKLILPIKRMSTKLNYTTRHLE